MPLPTKEWYPFTKILCDVSQGLTNKQSTKVTIRTAKKEEEEEQDQKIPLARFLIKTKAHKLRNRARWIQENKRVTDASLRSAIIPASTQTALS
jgi:hypothetical protein